MLTLRWEPREEPTLSDRHGAETGNSPGDILSVLKLPKLDRRRDRKIGQTVMDEPQYLLDVSLRRDKVENFDHYPFSIPAVRELDATRFSGAVTFLIGENGSGKSTLVEAIAVAHTDGIPRRYDISDRFYGNF